MGSREAEFFFIYSIGLNSRVHARTPAARYCALIGQAAVQMADVGAHNRLTLLEKSRSTDLWRLQKVARTLEDHAVAGPPYVCCMNLVGTVLLPEVRVHDVNDVGDFTVQGRVVREVDKGQKRSPWSGHAKQVWPRTSSALENSLCGRGCPGF